jgi:hypothetical protein
MALSAERNGEIFGLIAPLVIARPLAAQCGAIRGRPYLHVGLGIFAGAFAVLLVALVPATFALSAAFHYAPNPQITPAAAVEALKKAAPGPILNQYDFGGYLVYAGIPTFIDGRTELYGGAFFDRYYRAVTLADLAGFDRLLDRYRIKATLLAPGTPAIAYLDRLPGWHRLYADEIAVAHVRD